MKKYLILLFVSIMPLPNILAANINISVESVSYSTAKIEMRTSFAAPYIIGVQYRSSDSDSDFMESKKTVTSEQQVLDSYSFELTELEANTSYQYRGFVFSYETNETTYTDFDSFSTSAVTLSNEPYVDLGLSVKWGNCNLDANSPEQIGGYYAYGETEPKESFWDYAHEGSDLGDISGNPYFDAATKKLGDKWRLPKFEEVIELSEKCNLTVITYKNRNGMLVEAQNGNCIFLPFGGVWNGSILQDDNGIGVYWSGNKGKLPQYPDHEFTHWDIAYQGIFYQFGVWNSEGANIRPVYAETNSISSLVADSVAISVENGVISISSLNSGFPVQAYTLDGILLQETEPQNGSATIKCNLSGLVIIKIGGHSFKVVI